MLFCTWRPTRRDSAYSWIVAVAAFTSILFSIGVSFGSVGVMTVAFGDHYNDSKSSVLPWVGSSRLSFIFLSGVASSVLVNRFGARTVQLVGSALAALAIGLSALSTQLWHLLVTYGCLAGIGMSFVFTASSVVVEGHFTRFLHVVLPLTQLGDTVGYSVFPVSTQSLLDNVGFLNTLYFFCGVCGIPALCALLYTEPPPLDRLGAAGAAAASTAVAVVDYESCGKAATAASTVTAAAPPADKANGHIRLTEDIAMRCRQDGSVHNGGGGRSENGSDHVTLLRIRASDDENTSSTRSASPDDCGDGGGGHSGSAPNGIDAGSAKLSGRLAIAADVYAAAAADDVVADDVDATEADATANAVARSDVGDASSSATGNGTATTEPLPAKPTEPAATELGLLADLRNLLTSGDAWIVFVNTLLWPYTAASIVVLLPSYIVRADVVNKEQAALGLTIIGIANVVGNVATILLGLRRYNHALFYTASCGALGAGAMIYVVADHSVAGYYALCAFNGFWLGVILGLVVSIMYEYSGRASFTSMFGFSTFATGLGDLAGGGVTGIIQNQVGDDVGFYVSGAFSLVACAVMLPLAVRKYRRPASVEPS